MENHLHASSSKPRGRPVGSKNKPKKPGPSAYVQQDGVGMQTRVLEVAAGSDIIKAVSDFANRLKLDVSVISTYGLVQNPTVYRLHPPLQYPYVLNFEGIFDLLSLKATFHGFFATRPPPGFESRYIYFLDGEGIVSSGTVAGVLLAASKVFLVVSWNETGCKKPPLVSAPQPEVDSSARGSMGSYRVPSPTPPTWPCIHVANGYLCACGFK